MCKINSNLQLLGEVNNLCVDTNSQTVKLPIDSSCNIVLSDSKDTDKTSEKRNSKSNRCSYSNFWARNRFILLSGTVLILIIYFLKFMFDIILLHSAHNVPDYVEVQIIRQNYLDRPSSPEARPEEAMDDGSSFSDQTELAEQIMEAAKNDAFSIDGEDTGTRFKRDVSQDEKDCDLKVKQCSALLQSMQNYLEALKPHADESSLAVFKDIVACLKCKRMKSTTSPSNESTLSPNHQYFSYRHNLSDPLESGITVIKLLDNGNITEHSYPSTISSGNDGVNPTEAAKIRVANVSPIMNDISQNTNRSLGNADGVVVPVDRANSTSTQMNINGAINDSVTVSINNEQSDGNLIATDSRIIKNRDNQSVMSNVDEHRAIAESKVAKSEIIKLQFTTTRSNRGTTQYAISEGNVTSKVSTTTADSIGSSEASLDIDLTKQTTITENVMSERARHNVTGIGDMLHPSMYPSVHPSFEEHPENLSATSLNEPRAMKNYGPMDFIMSTDHDSKKDKNKPVEVRGQTGESMEANQHSQLTPKLSWTVPHPVCFYGQPGQSFGKQSPLEFFPSFPNPSFPQNHGPPFPNPYQGSSSPNFVQVHAQSVQFMPRSNYDDNLPQVQRTGSGFGPTGSPVPIFSNGQQPTAATATSFNKPYFCTYISLPTFQFSPNFGASQLDHSSRNIANNMPGKSPKSRDWPYSPVNPFMCPSDSRQCASDGYCVLKVKWCDGRVDCADASDEIVCSCRDRISRDRLCDGYFDCPHGEDELGCFECPEDTFSCEDWNRRNSHDNCVPVSQRCDGIEQCRNGKDEIDCNILSASYIDGKNIFMIGYTQGYLHKNVRGQWYPICSSEPSWAIDACTAETGQSVTTMPEIQIVHLPNNIFQGPYISGSKGQLEFVPSCSNSAVFVKCPPLPCGTRVLPRHDTSPAFNRGNSYMYKRQTKGQPASDASKFDNLYWNLLGLLNKFHSEEKEQERNDTMVGSQLRVVGGRASQPSAWPFLIAIYKDGNFHCGGVILSEIWILTAAHCMEEYEKHYYEVHAGMLRQFSFSPMAQSRKVKNIMLHPDYINSQMQNDIAIIMMDQPFLFNRWIRQVCLPMADTAGPRWKQSPTPQSMCVAIGWGASKEQGPDSGHLREVEVPILPSCKYFSDRNDAAICAGYSQGGYDACQGDSGGPLMCRNPDLESQWYVAGIISHGDGCGRPNEPGVYTKVSHFVQWVQELTKQSAIPFDEGILLDSCPGFSCQMGLGKCLSIEQRCDRIVDCLDAEDEIDCLFRTTYEQYKQSDSNNKFGTNNETSKFEKISTEGVSNDSIDNQTSTETVPISTLHEIQTQTDDESSTMNTITTSETTMSSVRITFTCTSLIQTIMINKRCDRHLDCEDGTDEKDCTCRDFLLNLRPSAICDGHLDCDDGTDEKNCGLCKDDEFHCSRSGMCIPMTRKCNSIFDCPLREDEIDCLALTNGEYVDVDSDNRPALITEGLLSRYTNGTWHIECLRSALLNNDTIKWTIGGNTCNYLGFVNLLSVDRVIVDSTELDSKSWRDNATGYESSANQVATSDGDGPCSGLRIRCRPVLSGSADAHLVVDPRNGNHTYLWPWLAAIFVDGRYRCSALLLEPDWLLSSSRCTEDIELSVNYTTSLLGQSRSYLYVDGPHQQISVVDEIKDVEHSNASLLHLRTAVNLTHYALPLFLEKKIYPPAESDVCVAIGTDEDYVTKSIFLRPILQNCSKCHRCFVAASSLECPANETSSDWSGTIFCRSQQGWYPAAVFHEYDGFCSFQGARNLTSIDYVHAYLTRALDETLRPTAEPTCDGVRCNIGRCVPRGQVCDGIVDCRDGADEEIEMCNEMQQIYSNDVNRKCAKSELRCMNGECMSKRTFCDRKVDCLDGTDEPVRCTCAEYLKLTAPERLCDGVRHCFDKTDESPEMCHCTEASFKCNSESQNITCIPQDFVCDDDQDCPNGEDEKQCRKLKESTRIQEKSGVGEVMERSYGVWHSKCYSTPVTSHEEAKVVCKEIEYINGTIEHENQIPSEPLVPSRDDFYMVRLNLETWITIRDDKPLVTLVRPEEPCYRLFVKCTR